MPLSDQEILCEFMEPLRSEGRWWMHGPPEVREFGEQVYFDDHAEPLVGKVIADKLYPIPLTLNECHLIEERLTDERIDYVSLLAGDSIQGEDCESIDWLDGLWVVAHADAPTKIKALAEVLRPVVEGRKG